MAEGKVPGPAPEGKIRRSWRLTRIAWGVARDEPTILALALMGAVFATLVALAVIYLGGPSGDGDGAQRGQYALVGLLILWPATFVATFVNVALAAAAGEALEGRSCSVREALSVAVSRLDQIFLWSLLTAAVGFVLRQVAARLPFGGRVAVWLVGAAWGLATVFVIPILSLEGAKPLPALRRSTRLVKERWGEEIAGQITISAWTVVVVFPASILAGVGAAFVDSDPALGTLLVSIGVVSLVVVFVLSSAVSQVFTVALYRYAADGTIGHDFGAGELERPFAGTADGSPETPKSRSRWREWLLGGVALMSVLVFLAGSRDDTRTPGYAPPPAATSSVLPAHTLIYAAHFEPAELSHITAGLPVLYRGNQVGRVEGLGLEGPDSAALSVPDSLRPVMTAGARAYVLARPGGFVVELRPVATPSR